jgi:hypothetical protein
MHDERNTLTDAALDREIERALAVAPSPEFVARVRTRIANEPSPSGWRFGGMIAAVVTVAAAVIIAALLAQRTDRAPGPVDTAPVTARMIAGGWTPMLEPGRTSLSLPVARGSTLRVPQGDGELVEPLKDPRALRRPEAEPLIDTREVDALQSLIAGVARGRVDLTPLLQPAAPAPMELLLITDIVIPPITIDPIAPVDGAQGERQ